MITIRRNGRTPVVLGILLTPVLCSLLASGCGKSAGGGAPTVRHVKGPGIRGEGLLCLRGSPQSPGGLLFMVTSVADPNMLLDPNGPIGPRPGAIYFRLDTANSTLVPSSANEWVLSSDPATDELTQLGPPFGPFVEDFERHALTFKGAPVATAGPFVMRTRCSPSKRFLAVISTDGPVGSAWLGLGSGGSSSAHYLEIFSYADGRVAGKAIRLPFNTAKALFDCHWTADESCVLCSNPMLFDIYIVTLPAPFARGDP